MTRWLATALILLLLTACGGEQQATAPAEPENPDRSASCAVCGMTVVDYPGPKAQIHLKGKAAPKHFCSTRDFFAYLLEEDSPRAHRIRAMFVHDMGRTDWEHPHQGEAHWVPAREAFYVVGSDRRGAMGPTLAAFAERAAAEAFAAEHGGEIKPFDAIDRELVVNMPPPKPPQGRRGGGS
jgi:copper chaperone NosL